MLAIHRGSVVLLDLDDCVYIVPSGGGYTLTFHVKGEDAATVSRWIEKNVPPPRGWRKDPPSR